MGMVFDDDHRLWLKQIEHLPGDVVHRLGQRRAALRARLGK